MPVRSALVGASEPGEGVIDRPSPVAVAARSTVMVLAGRNVGKLTRPFVCRRQNCFMRFGDGVLSGHTRSGGESLAVLAGQEGPQGLLGDPGQIDGVDPVVGVADDLGAALLGRGRDAAAHILP